jgi:SAM-dependent methyltransferase
MKFISRGVLAAVALCATAQPIVHTTRYSDLAPAVQRLLSNAGVEAAGFDRYIEGIERRTAERERDGENDHLIFYILQSQEFTKAARLEPALCAKEYVESGTISQGVRKRLEQFAATNAESERLAYFRSLLPRENRIEYLRQEYARAMRSLYAKEFESKPHYYESRGHSTDTQVTANYAIWTALSVLKASQPALKLDRVLIVGPGLDVAPRTDLTDRYPPQSYQPYAVSVALRDRGFSDAPQVYCVDINARVIRFIRDFAGRPEPRLEYPVLRGDAEYEDWARRLGPKLAPVPKRIAEAVSAQQLNIITQRLDSRYDLVIATNVLVYFDDTELLLAMANIDSMMHPGAYFIHNELRPAIDQYAAAVGLTPLQARTVKIGEGKKAPLYDAFAIYRKK